MKNSKLCCSIDQIDICVSTISILQKNGIEFIWQLVTMNEQILVSMIGTHNARLIRRGLEEYNSEGLNNLVDSILDKKISDFPEVHSLVDIHLKDKKLIYLFGAELSEAKKCLISIFHQRILKFAS